MRFASIFKKIKNLEKKLYHDKIIDIERLEVFSDYKAAAKALHRHPIRILNAIDESARINGRLLERLDEWLKWDSACKERYTKDRNIYFY